MVKNGFRASRRFLDDTRGGAMVLAVPFVSHNDCPLSRFGPPPIFLLTGRSDFPEWSKALGENEEVSPHGHHSGQRFQAMIADMKKILEKDAKRAIRTADSAHIRTRACDVFSMGGSISRWIPSDVEMAAWI